jgi:hypothetical protein
MKETQMTRATGTKLIYGKYTAKEYAELLLKDLIPHPVMVEEGHPDYPGDDVILRIAGYIEIYELEDMVISESLLGPVRGTGYEIGRVKMYNNYPFEPDDADYEGEDEEPHLCRAVECAVRKVQEDEMHNSIQGISQQAYSEELEEQEAY